jgi:rfaE bifunctional protein nucleotidyltransferase chain/domain
VNFREKIFNPATLLPWRETVRRAGRRLVVTNGSFEIQHSGQDAYLENARNQGDALLVGITSDAGTRQLKGPDRPINAEEDRAAVLAALQSVDGVFVFPETTAVNFLTTVKPDIYVKGGDYTIDTINQEERRLVERMGGKILILPGVPGRSTTSVLAKIARL